MCEWSINWGDVPTWIGAIGTLLAILWAVFLYRSSIEDGKRSQARLLAPVGGAAPVQALPGSVVSSPSSIDVDVYQNSTTLQLLLSEEACWSRVRLVSTSDETFSDIRVWLLLRDGTEVPFRMGFSEMAPHSDESYTHYYRPGVIFGTMKVRVQFRDANGRWWERVNGEPVRELRGPSLDS